MTRLFAAFFTAAILAGAVYAEQEAKGQRIALPELFGKAYLFERIGGQFPGQTVYRFGNSLSTNVGQPVLPIFDENGNEVGAAHMDPRTNNPTMHVTGAGSGGPNSGGANGFVYFINSLLAGGLGGNYNQAQPPPPRPRRKDLFDGLVAHWTMDEFVNGRQIVDFTGLRLGDVLDATAVDVVGIPALGRALRFAGGQFGQVDFGTHSSVGGTGDFGVSIVVNPDPAGQGTNRAVVSQEFGGVGFYVDVSSTGTARFLVGDVNQPAGQQIQFDVQAPTVIDQANNWFVITASRSDLTGTVCVAGVSGSPQCESETGAFVTALDSSVALQLGRSPAGDGFPYRGDLDQFRIYNRALTFNDVLDLQAELQAGSSTFFEGFYANFLSEGQTYSISAFASPWSSSTFEAAEIAAPTAPDLRVQGVATSTISATPGSSIQIDATIINDGNSNAGATTARFLTSNDSTISTADTLEVSASISALSAGASRSTSASFALPDREGSVWVGICVDAVSGETNTSNNCSTGIEVALATAAQPDLAVDAISANPTQVAPSGSTTLSATLINRGEARSDGSTIRFLRSTNSTITTSDTQIATASLGALSAGARSTINRQLALPAQTRSYWLGICIDVVANEASTGNNCSAGVRVDVQSQVTPDLAPNAPTLSRTTAEPGQAFDLDATIRNLGQADSPQSVARFYQSSDSTITVSDSQLASIGLPALSAGATTTVSVGLNAPTMPGDYWYGVCVDAVSGETTTSNNCSSGVRLSVRSGNTGTNLDVSGIWFNPDEPGHGWFIEQLDSGSKGATPMLNAYWYVYLNGAPAWLIANGPLVGNRAELDVFTTSGADFPPRFNSAAVQLTPWGTVTFDFNNGDNGTLGWVSSEPGFGSGSMPLTRITGVAASAAGCDSGSFFNIDQSGHGFSVQIVAGNQLLVAWYVYLQGQQVWLLGQAPYAASGPTEMQLFIYSGPDFPPNFVADDVQSRYWGNLSFELTGPDTARVSWQTTTDSFLEGYRDGSLDLTRLTRVDCG